ncbi:hypothetical protein LPJ78_001637 [Coemansia sp. RSA 989]|nr:hypothetical protein LPJ79_000798 [Coemansia sp. RSA 1821]KAJ1866686.1 hypothetical protein LPJ78_001637 [Coemansia sp. RSA 989]KAJ1875491.1 hypothetical protein LPJ55_000656 [Coemansia sp. RSA 990]KAJ2651928.1 hypothetical protein IWW40_001476 [Coemansia sp. RSA 1250]KAJ2674955.1 hypothetical protein IWW42_001457 [Coemansia sp. RSA 1085]
MVSIRTLAAAAAAAAAAAVEVAGMYAGASAVKQLTPRNFDRVVGRTSQPTFVEFYAPWCGHCQRLEPEYERAAARTRGIAKFYAVNCDEESNRALCARFNVQGFPTLKVFNEKRSKRGLRRSVDYQGPRKASAMAKFARSMLPSLSTNLGSGELDKFVTGSDKPKAVLLTTRPKPSDLWHGLAAHFDRRVTFAHVIDPESQVLERLGVNELPAIAVFPDSSNTFELYNGETRYAPLVKFVHRAGIAKQTSGNSGQPAPSRLEVQQITTQADLERLCIESAEQSPIPVVCIISVLALEPEYEESRSEHAQAVSVLEKVLSSQKLRSPHAPSGTSSDDDEEEDSASSTKDSPPFRVAWVNALDAAGQQIRKLFELSDDVPAVVAVSPRKNAVAPYRGAFTSTDILDWAEQCYQGRGMRKLTAELSIADTQTAPAHDEL